MKLYLAILALFVNPGADATPSWISNYKDTHIGNWYIESDGELSCIAYTAGPSGGVNISVRDRLIPGGRSDQSFGHLLIVGFANDQWESLNQRFGDRVRVSFHFSYGVASDGMGVFRRNKVRRSLPLGSGYDTSIGVELNEKEINDENIDRISDERELFLGPLSSGGPVRIDVGSEHVATVNFEDWKIVRPEFAKCLASWSSQ